VGQISPWKVLDAKYLYQDQWLQLRSETVLLPNGKKLAPFHTIECANWVIAIAINHEGKIILVEQYRHGVKHITLELPGGTFTDDTEVPEAAVKRELLEETGYASSDWHYLGSSFLAAARMTTRIYAYLAIDARKIADPTPDDGEIIVNREIPWTEFLTGMRSGRVTLHETNHLAGLFQLQLFAAKASDPRIRELLI